MPEITTREVPVYGRSGGVAVWAIPDGYLPDSRTVACRSCGAEVLFCTTKSGRRGPYDRDGISHFATCPQRDQWRRPR